MSLVSIGEFAQASRLSPKALRLYDELGLLVPAHVEAFVRQEAPGAWAGGTRAELALQALRTWATEHRRQPLGGIRMVLVGNPANGERGPDSQFAVALR